MQSEFDRDRLETALSSGAKAAAAMLLLLLPLAPVSLAQEASSATSLPGSPEAGTETAPKRNVRHPVVDLGVLSFPSRASAQAKALAGAPVMHEFRFVDRQELSGLDFDHGIVDDSGKTYKPVHYDHGNGLVVVDVDGDGREDLFFLNQFGANGLYRSLGEGKFEDITAKAGVAMAEQIGVSASAADYDNDGDADLYVTTVRMGNVLFENDGKGRFEDVTEEKGLSLLAHSSGAVFFDFDRDGWLDLFVSNVGQYTVKERGRGGYFLGRPDAFQGHLHPDRTEQSILYRNLGGEKFVDVSRQTGLVDTSWSGDASFTDLDADGFPELYVLNMQGDDHFWVGEGGKAFVDRRSEVFPKTSWGAMGIGFFDFDNDGDQDLYVTDMHSDMVEDITPDREVLKSRVDPDMPGLQGGRDNIFGNSFYEQDGEGSFAERSDAVGLENYWPWGLSVGDVNADGYEDVFVASSMNYPFRYGPSSLFLNVGGERFLDAAFSLGIEPRAENATHKPWFEVDCSGADREHEHCVDGLGKALQGQWTIWGTLGSRSSAFLDLDDDGDLDLVTAEMNAKPQVFFSDLAQQKDLRFLKLRLVGSTSNRDGLGAIVEVVSGEMRQTQIHDGKSGYLSQSRAALYFGLGEAKKVDLIRVRWPSGTVQTLEDVSPNQLLEITEPPKKK